MAPPCVRRPSIAVDNARALAKRLPHDFEEHRAAERERLASLQAELGSELERCSSDRSAAVDPEVQRERKRLEERRQAAARTYASALERFGPPQENEAPAGVTACGVPDPEHQPQTATPAGDVTAKSTPATTSPRTDRIALTQNPRKLRYHRTITQAACTALHKANGVARRSKADAVQRLDVPRQIHQLAHELCDNTDALAGALDWVRRMHGPGVALDVEAGSLYRERGGKQHDDWNADRARRKFVLLLVFLMAPFELKRSSVTGSTSDEWMLVTAGIPQTLLVLLTHSGQREPYSTRTLQRDLKEIDECTDLLLRWRTPAEKAEAWEVQGRKHGVVNRYCVRAGMIREQWKRARDAGEALVKSMSLQLAAWMVWRPAPDRGSLVPLQSGAPS